MKVKRLADALFHNGILITYAKTIIVTAGEYVFLDCARELLE